LKRFVFLLLLSPLLFSFLPPLPFDYTSRYALLAQIFNHSTWSGNQCAHLPSIILLPSSSLLLPADRCLIVHSSDDTNGGLWVLDSLGRSTTAHAPWCSDKSLDGSGCCQLGACIVDSP
jgi:hypothetical protein